MPKNRQSARDYLSIIGPVILFSLLGFFAAYQFVDPAPPQHLTIATARKDGAYYQFSPRYQRALRRQGIELEILQTPGSVANLKLLLTPDNAIDVAFVQGGTATPEQRTQLQSIASLYFEPLWVFYRLDSPLTSLLQARGKSITRPSSDQ